MQSVTRTCFDSNRKPAMSPGVSKLLSLCAPAPNALCQSETQGQSRLWALSGSLTEASAWLHEVDPSSCSLRRLQIPKECRAAESCSFPFARLVCTPAQSPSHYPTSAPSGSPLPANEGESRLHPRNCVRGRHLVAMRKMCMPITELGLEPVCAFQLCPWSPSRGRRLFSFHVC